MSTSRIKMEFWINPADKRLLTTLCEKAGYTVAEIMRRAVEDKIKELHAKVTT